jgi:flagellar hook-basal body complex protein FliE
LEITPIGYSPFPIDLAQTGGAGGTQQSFGDMLNSAIQSVNQQQKYADGLSMQAALGKDVDVHDAVLATEEAQLSFQYALQVRNKLIEAYQEVMRMSV